MLSLGVDRRINQNPEYNRKIRIQPENQNTNGISEYKRNIRIQSEYQNTIGNPEYNQKLRIQSENQNTNGISEYKRKSRIQSKNWNTYRKNRTTYKKNKTGGIIKTQKKRGMQQMHISAAKIIYGEDDRTKKHHQRI